jgi:hypothetical protein
MPHSGHPWILAAPALSGGAGLPPHPGCPTSSCLGNYPGVDTLMYLATGEDVERRGREREKDLIDVRHWRASVGLLYTQIGQKARVQEQNRNGIAQTLSEGKGTDERKDRKQMKP